MKTLGIIGFGSFGRFMVHHLRPFFHISIHDRRDVAVAAQSLEVPCVELGEVIAKDILVLGVPVQDLEDLLKEIGPRIKPPTLVLDVSSVKVKPFGLLSRYVDPELEVIGTHPMFGPQSGRHGVEGLKIVLCPLRTTQLHRVRSFLADELKLSVIEMAPQRHDAEMAYIQGLTHWIAKALREIKVPDLELSTPAYRHLLKIEEILREDSLDLFLTIQRENPYAGSARCELLERLGQIEEWIRAEE